MIAVVYTTKDGLIINTRTKSELGCYILVAFGDYDAQNHLQIEKTSTYLNWYQKGQKRDLTLRKALTGGAFDPVKWKRLGSRFTNLNA